MTTEQTTKLKRALWLAFQAAQPVGMGILHAEAAARQTEDSLFDDYGPMDDKAEIYTDYVCGRMMKTLFMVTADNQLVIQPEAPRIDYQSWARQYPHAQNLINAVEESLK